ncbi:unnamed protein product [Rangifer tarandus platyrhynchus]|uniref:Uncharacterized protein n=2 Tax=Rangifer tarandus platyrhynchus TaxID=3082113 RepID=A0AC59Z3L3_RANTA|nr:unnamed protein product [Rangifer tarandus platyrhynchus]
MQKVPDREPQVRKWVQEFVLHAVLPARLMERTVGKSASSSQCEDPDTYNPTGTAHMYTTHFPCSRKNTERVTYACMHAQLCPTLCHPMGYSPPGFSVHGILQARILEWVAISFSNNTYRYI